MRTASLLSILGVIAALTGFAVALAGPASAAHTSCPAVSFPPRIVAPASVGAGTDFCFDVITLSGATSVLIEINEVTLPFTPSSPTDGTTTTWCGRVPAGASGSTITITVVSANGAIATATVAVT